MKDIDIALVFVKLVSDTEVITPKVDICSIPIVVVFITPKFINSFTTAILLYHNEALE